MVFYQDAEKVALLTRPVPARREAAFPRRRSQLHVSRTVKGEAYELLNDLAPNPFAFYVSRLTDRWTAFLSILLETGRPCFSSREAGPSLLNDER